MIIATTPNESRRGARRGQERSFAVLLALLGSVLYLVVGCGDTGHERKDTRTQGQAPAQGKSILLTDRTWHCRRPVDLDLVRVTMHGGRSDAVHLDDGCTGTIRKLVVVGNGEEVGPGGDGVKVHAGAHDLKILSGVIECGHKYRRKHQDAIQAMGGKRVTFVDIVSAGCANSFMFISAGLHRHELPFEVVCRNCSAATRNYSVRVNAAVRSGAIGGSYTSRLKPNSGPEAVDPVLVGNRWKPRE